MLTAICWCTSLRAEAPYDIAWARQYDGAGADSVAVDVAGSAYICGWVDVEGINEIYLTKYDTAGGLLWERRLETPKRIENEERKFSVATDALNNVYLSGPITKGVSDDYDAFVSKFDSAGNQIWWRQFGTVKFDQSMSVATDGLGNSYITGATYGALGGANAGRPDAFLTKFSTAGDMVWSRQVGTREFDEGYSVAVDSSGNAFIAGTTLGSLGGSSAGSYDAFLTKFDGAGNQLWSRQIGSEDWDEGRAVAVDSAGNAYICGYTQGIISGESEGGNDAFLTKFDSAGNVVWLRQFGSSLNEGGYAVAVDESGNAYAAGYFHTDVDGPEILDAFFTYFDSAGNLLWTTRFGTDEFDWANSLAADRSGSIYLAGISEGSLVGPNGGNDEGDAFLIKYVVPEPSTLVLAALGVIGITALRGRRSHRRSQPHVERQ